LLVFKIVEFDLLSQFCEHQNIEKIIFFWELKFNISLEKLFDAFMLQHIYLCDVWNLQRVLNSISF